MSSRAEEASGLRTDLERLRALVLARLIDILENGAPVQKPDAKTGLIVEIGRAPASPAYFSAAIRFLKENGATATAEGVEDLEAVLAALPDFDDEEDDDEQDEDR